MTYPATITLAATGLASSEIFANKAIASAAQVIENAWAGGYASYQSINTALDALDTAVSAVVADLVNNYSPDLTGVSWAPTTLSDPSRPSPVAHGYAPDTSGVDFTPATLADPSRPSPVAHGYAPDTSGVDLAPSTLTTPTRPSPLTPTTTPTDPSATTLTQEQWNAIFAPRLADVQRVQAGEYMSALKTASGRGYGTMTAALAKVQAEVSAKQYESTARLAGEQAAAQAAAMREDVKWAKETAIKLWQIGDDLRFAASRLANEEWAIGVSVLQALIAKDQSRREFSALNLQSILDTAKTEADFGLRSQELSNSQWAVGVNLLQAQVQKDALRREFSALELQAILDVAKTNADFKLQVERIANEHWQANIGLLQAQVQKDQVRLGYIAKQVEALLEMEKTSASFDIDAAQRQGAVQLDMAKYQVETLAAMHGTLMNLIDIGLSGSGEQSVTE